MAITSNRITDEEKDALHVQAQPDRLTGTANQNKAVFDALPELIVSRYNQALVDTKDAIDDVIGYVSSGGVEPLSENTAFNQDFETDASELKQNGTANVGTSDNVPRADHIHPTDETRASVKEAFVAPSVVADYNYAGMISVNLLTAPYYDGASHTSHGVTFTESGGILSVSGSSLGLNIGYYTIVNASENKKFGLVAGDRICVNAKPSNTSNHLNVYLGFIDADDEDIATYSGEDEIVNIEVPEGIAKIHLEVEVNYGTAYSSTVKPMIYKVEG